MRLVLVLMRVIPTSPSCLSLELDCEEISFTESKPFQLILQIAIFLFFVYSCNLFLNMSNKDV